ncbi:kinase-like domain-containing protein [Coniella lustricola]|uniref:Kinase-like domain-containing protein n=1 Tax=Coniella lustricola TaxID=2025994 RepID=A0A2T3AAJ9_9PEZI|nr:kinase-like domain-containing protein [Coniella lustricola]
MADIDGETKDEDPTHTDLLNDDDLDKFEKMDYTDAVTGTELHNFWGGKVIEHTVPATGELIALKVKPRSGLHRSEPELMHYAATHGVLAPRVRGLYDVQSRPTARVMVSERVPGVPLVEVWQTASVAEQESYKMQLRAQLEQMRRCTQPFIGRLRVRKGVAHEQRLPTYNIYDRLQTTYCGPFATEQEFDEWCWQRAAPKMLSPLSRFKWKRFMEKEQLQQQRQGNGKFVLTHGDLTPRNIMVDKGKITGIVDWERGGFYPEYAEYAFAMALGHQIEKWWMPVLKELLQPCSKDRVKFTKLVEFRGW